MKVDAHISHAIDTYIAEHNTTQKEFAKVCGVSETTLVKWRRQGSGITSIRWKRLFELIRPYLPTSRIYIASSGEEAYSSLNEGAGRHDYFEPKFIPAMIPVLDEKALLKYNSFVQSIEQFAFEFNLPRIEFRPRVQSAGGLFCFKLEESQAGIPAGAFSTMASCSSAVVVSRTCSINKRSLSRIVFFSVMGTVMASAASRLSHFSR